MITFVNTLINVRLFYDLCTLEEGPRLPLSFLRLSMETEKYDTMKEGEFTRHVNCGFRFHNIENTTDYRLHNRRNLRQKHEHDSRTGYRAFRINYSASACRAGRERAIFSEFTIYTVRKAGNESA